MSREDIIFPETVYVSITTHGKIEINKPTDSTSVGTPVIFHIPENMTLTKISAVAPGICNFLSPNSSKNIISKYVNLIQLSSIGDEMEVAKIINQDIKSYIKQDVESEIPDKDTIAHVFALDKLRDNIVTYTNKCINKEFIIFFDEIHFNETYHNEINIFYKDTDLSSVKTYNFFDAMNIHYLTELHTARQQKQIIERIIQKEGISKHTNVKALEDLEQILKDIMKITLQDIMEILHKHGVKNIILLDLSCSSYSSRVSDRSARNFNRELFSQNLFGGKMKTRIIQKNNMHGKHRRSKHRRSKHRHSKPNINSSYHKKHKTVKCFPRKKY